MPAAASRSVAVPLADSRRVAGLLNVPRGTDVCYVVAHGAGAGMAHPFLEAVAEGLAARGIATLRYQFPYMDRGARRPDPPRAAQEAVRAAVAEAARLLPDAALIAGGKSYGGRMTSQAQAERPLPGVRGLAFLGFPLHAAGRPSDERARHLDDVAVPMLFLQGTRDALADVALLTALADRLEGRATLELLEEADHSWRVTARSGRKGADVMNEALDALAAWIERVRS